MQFSELVNYFISLLVLCSPFSALPALIGLTHGMSDDEKRRTGMIAGIAVGVILVSMTWVGGPFLDFLGISVPAFQVAGGFVVFMLAMSMLNAETSRIKQTTEDQKEARYKHSIAIVPLAIPIMAGPGAISALVLGITLYFSTKFERMLGQTGINIVNRIAGLILSAMAVQTIAKGIIGLFPFLGGGHSFQ
jgi:multiple antibiotic resistance protein